MTPEWIVVGAGFTGATLAERIATQLDQRVLVVDRRDHIGGNAFDERNEHGILVHRYGPHIFHTNSEKVWSYLSRFTSWRAYEHRVLASIEEKMVPVPFNLTSLGRLLPRTKALRLERRLRQSFGMEAKIPVLQLRQSEDGDLRALGDLIYDRLFLGYTKKQWGLTPEELDPSVTGRVPVHISYDDRYFQDRYQAIPADGYAAMFQRMLSDPRIEVATGVSFDQVRRDAQTSRVVFTGPIDALLGFRFGPLPYRSLRFETTTRPGALVQNVATVNFPGSEPYTRITEQKWITGQQSALTTLVAEYPQPHIHEENEPYYPIPRSDHRALHERYLQDAEAEYPQAVFAGRLADYRYYNMDQAVARALAVFEKRVAPCR